MAYTKVEIGYFVGSYDTIGVKTKVKKKKEIQMGIFFCVLVYNE